MKFTPKIDQALKKAAVLHFGQNRKSPGNVPYITHPYSVATLLSCYTDDEDVIVAGLLHDTIEDCKYSPSQLESDFGPRVREIVMGVTEQKNDDRGAERSWMDRKQDYIKNLASDCQESLLVCAADKICNMCNQVEDFRLHGPAIFASFNSTPKERYWYHREVLKVLKKRLIDCTILVKYKKKLDLTAGFR